MRLRNGIRVGILGLIVAAAITPGVAMAADFRVTTTADGDDKECALDCTLREGVILAGSGDQVLVPSGTYVLTGGELSLNNDTSRLTGVVRGRVSVRDFVEKRTVIVKAGKKYVARAR